MKKLFKLLFVSMIVWITLSSWVDIPIVDQTEKAHVEFVEDGTDLTVGVVLTANKDGTTVSSSYSYKNYPKQEPQVVLIALSQERYIVMISKKNTRKPIANNMFMKKAGVERQQNRVECYNTNKENRNALDDPRIRGHDHI